MDIPANKKLTAEGEYLVIVYDKAYNISYVKVTIDTTDPVVKNVESGKVYKEVTPEVTDKHLSKVSVERNTEDYEFTLGDTITEDGSYVLVARDAAGNKTTVNFIIDNSPADIIAPSISKEVAIRDEILSFKGTAKDIVDGEWTIYPEVYVNGVKDEIWLENSDGPYRIVRINSNNIFNKEQLKYIPEGQKIKLSNVSILKAFFQKEECQIPVHAGKDLP